jgi:hypothetical protein
MDLNTKLWKFNAEITGLESQKLISNKIKTIEQETLNDGCTVFLTW